MSDAPAPQKRGKSKGRHPVDRLTARTVANAKPGRHADGNGLHLVVDSTGARRWLLRLVVGNRRIDLGLGGAAYVSLADARAEARRLRAIARAGGDPKAARDAAKRDAPTFEEAAKTVFREQVEPVAKPGRHVGEWLRSLERASFPTMGKTPVNLIGEADVLKVLSPIWHETPETARRIRRRMAQVLEWARAAGHRSGENPVDRVKPGAGLAKQRDKVKHFAALPYDELPTLWRRLIAVEGMGAAALRFAILTAARSGEVRGAAWDEIDEEAKVWSIPGERMKAGEDHRVPLSAAALAEIERVKPLANVRGGGLIFPSRMGTPVSDMTLAAVLKRLDVGVTVHGFRSTFRDWCEERARARRAVSEAALAHKVEDKVERAYRRGDLLKERTPLMDDWAQFVTGATGKVIELRSGRVGG